MSGGNTLKIIDQITLHFSQSYAKKNQALCKEQDALNFSSADVCQEKNPSSFKKHTISEIISLSIFSRFGDDEPIIADFHPEKTTWYQDCINAFFSIIFFPLQLIPLAYQDMQDRIESSKSLKNGMHTNASEISEIYAKAYFVLQTIFALALAVALTISFIARVISTINTPKNELLDHEPLVLASTII